MRTAFGETFDVPTGYLNTAGIGVPPTSVADAVAVGVSMWRTGSVQPHEYDKHVAVAREAWARLTGVPTASVGTGASVSQMISLVAASLPVTTRVVTVRNEFTSATFPFAARGMPVTEVEPADLVRAAREHDLVVVSVVQSADGTVADLAGLRATGTPVLLDVTQAAGWLPLDLDWADWVVGGSYKWLLAPRGAAWLAVRPDLLELTRPVAANWYAGEDPWDSIYGLPLRLAGNARRFDLGPVWFSQLGAAAALPWLADLDRTRVRDHCVGLANATLAGLNLPPADSAIISIDVPDAAARLTRAGVRASVRAGRTRLAFHLYNTQEDVDLVLGSLGSAA
ncbi:MAG TPA: aminotransferase class V-fold PLP-dependent enzyme [Actinophytocola sp.]|uniref:aminotransferase class V-fold PLP-dependent enzyme n=1 Tax=Actinophytocola sp. TaxID=1872138 RepID=UPI002DB846C1|nr:aminotransferase class V-fold PLP-dependent enzyme [Actinophytocola sp.]HEU5475007.1 aminotransferase class V-fold PLP-dependent enzyme [Actinophytocola sp.]